MAKDNSRSGEERTNHHPSFAAVTRAYRETQNLTQDDFARALSEKIRSTTLPQTRQGISLWEQGKTEPTLEDLFWMLMIYGDWRMEYAIDGICAKMPEVFTRDEHGALTVLKPTGYTG